jgi:hypothetical protein
MKTAYKYFQLLTSLFGLPNTALILYNFCTLRSQIYLDGYLVTTAWHILRLQTEKKAHPDKKSNCKYAEEAVINRKGTGLDGGSMFLQNVGIHLKVHIVPQPRRPRGHLQCHENLISHNHLIKNSNLGLKLILWIEPAPEKAQWQIPNELPGAITRNCSISCIIITCSRMALYH